MSIIEAALEKLRRSGSAPGAALGALLRRPGSAAPAPGPGRIGSPAAEIAKKSITVDPAALRRAGYLCEESLERRFAEYYRRIKRPLIEQALAGGPEMRLILVSSALPGVGHADRDAG